MILDLTGYDPNGPAWLPMGLPRWMGWKYTSRNGRRIKMPLSVRGGPGSVSDPETWGTRGQAVACKGDGVGYVLGHVREEGRYVCGIDLDGCLEDGEVVDDLASDILQRFKTYCEVSPSGRGIHLIFTMNVEDVRALNLAGRVVIRNSPGDHREIALDVSDRYYTFTDNAYAYEGKKSQEYVWNMKRALVEWLLKQRIATSPGVGVGGRDESGSGHGFRYFMKWYGRSGDDYRGALRDIRANQGRAGDWARRTTERELERAWEEAVARVDRPREATGGVTSLDQFGEKEPEWLRPGWPRGAVVLVAGLSGVGKSTMLYDFYARISRGAEWPVGDGRVYDPELVLMLNCEDSKESIIKPRMRIARANMSKVALIDRPKEDGKVRPFSLASDLPLLEGLIAKHHPAVIGIDPVSAYMGLTGRDNSRSAPDVRAVLDPLADLADRTGVTIILITHFRKSGADRNFNPLNMVVDSQAYTALPRVVWMVASDPDEPEHVYLMTAKNQYTRRSKWLNLGFELVDKEGISKVKWDKDAAQVTLHEVLVPKKPGRPETAVLDARDFLEKMLEAGPVPTAKVREAADKYNLSERTLYRARDDLGVETFRKDGQQCWRIPKKSSKNT